jgi:hypothetical protein
MVLYKEVETLKVKKFHVFLTNYAKMSLSQRCTIFECFGVFFIIKNPKSISNWTNNFLQYNFCYQLLLIVLLTYNLKVPLSRQDISFTCKIWLVVDKLNILKTSRFDFGSWISRVVDLRLFDDEWSVSTCRTLVSFLATFSAGFFLK